MIEIVKVNYEHRGRKPIKSIRMRKCKLQYLVRMAGIIFDLRLSKIEGQKAHLKCLNDNCPGSLVITFSPDIKTTLWNNAVVFESSVDLVCDSSNYTVPSEPDKCDHLCQKHIPKLHSVSKKPSEKKYRGLSFTFHDGERFFDMTIVRVYQKTISLRCEKAACDARVTLKLRSHLSDRVKSLKSQGKANDFCKKISDDDLMNIMNYAVICRENVGRCKKSGLIKTFRQVKHGADCGTLNLGPRKVEADEILDSVNLSGVDTVDLDFSTIEIGSDDEVIELGSIEEVQTPILSGLGPIPAELAALFPSGIPCMHLQMDDLRDKIKYKST